MLMRLLITKLSVATFALALILASHAALARKAGKVGPIHRSNLQGFVDEHNAARAAVGVGPIKWNYTVAAYAQRYANSRIHGCDMEHSEGPFGENLAEGYGEMSGAEAVKFWVTEKPNYDYESNKCVGDECGHYTQVVWRDSVHLGCASVKCTNNWVFVICSYDPPGNYEDERPY